MSLNLEKHLNPRKKRKAVEKEFVKINNTSDLQRLRVERLMKNPDREIKFRDTKTDDQLMPKPLEYNPHVQSATAGAGSGEFHVYRADRRREEQRQEWLDMVEQKRIDREEYEKTQQHHDEVDSAKTAKKRAKRLKSKLRKQQGKKEEPQEKKKKTDRSGVNAADRTKESKLASTTSQDKAQESQGEAQESQGEAQEPEAQEK